MSAGEVAREVQEASKLTGSAGEASKAREQDGNVGDSHVGGVGWSGDVSVARFRDGQQQSVSGAFDVIEERRSW